MIDTASCLDAATRSRRGGGETGGAAGPRVLLQHRTRYAYDRPVRLSAHEIRLRPTAHARAPIESYGMRISPETHDLKWLQDPNGNWVARVLFASAVSQLTIDVDLVARLEPVNPFDFYVDDTAWQFPFEYSPAHRHALAPYLALDATGARTAAWIRRMRDRFLRVPLDTIEFLVAVTRWVADDVRYQPRMEPGIQSCEQTLAAASGSCRDSAWLLAQLLRHTGIAARYVSGDLIQLDAGAAGTPPGADHVALHAWCEAYVPGAGWIGLDTTSGLLATEAHIPLAASALSADTAPVIGYVEESDSRLAVQMQLTRLDAEAPSRG
jgi:transglutaminase-like putative cysteine protease